MPTSLAGIGLRHFQQSPDQIKSLSKSLQTRGSDFVLSQSTPHFWGDHIVMFPSRCYAVFDNLGCSTWFPQGFRLKKNPADCLRSVGKTYWLITLPITRSTRTHDRCLKSIADPLICMLGTRMPPRTHMLPFDLLPTTLVQGCAES